uniref:Cadherin N-terminal domain-containing protein n=1 Tax=Pseudonaja textilis TaxID=8673 RepID=A0A670Y722_PSETE
MGETQRLQSYKNKILQCLIAIFIWKAISGNNHYVVREEALKGFFVENIAMDLGIDSKNLSEYGLWIATRTGMVQYFALNYNNGYLHPSERIDREKNVDGQRTVF